MKPTILASGIFMWFGSERQTDRYGAFYASPENFDNDVKVTVKVYRSNVDKFIGKRVRIIAEVTENRTSGHAGDSFHDLLPNPAKVGSKVEVGIGTLTTEEKEGHVFLIVSPDDGRKEFWMNPKRFFELHDQTVKIYAEETTDPAPEVFKGKPVVGDQAIVNGDGTLQTKTKNPPTKTTRAFSISPEIVPMGDGMFIATAPKMSPGSRHDLQRRFSIDHGPWFPGSGS